MLDPETIRNKFTGQALLKRFTVVPSLAIVALNLFQGLINFQSRDPKRLTRLDIMFDSRKAVSF